MKRRLKLFVWNETKTLFSYLFNYQTKSSCIRRAILRSGSVRVRELNNIIEKYSKEKNTLFLISSHQLKELEDLCDRFLLLENHQIREIDLHNRIFTQS